MRRTSSTIATLLLLIGYRVLALAGLMALGILITYRFGG
jgi:hypothetical protein